MLFSTQVNYVAVNSEKVHRRFKQVCKERGLKMGAVATRLIEQFNNENFRTSRKKAGR